MEPGTKDGFVDFPGLGLGFNEGLEVFDQPAGILQRVLVVVAEMVVGQHRPPGHPAVPFAECGFVECAAEEILAVSLLVGGEGLQHQDLVGIRRVGKEFFPEREHSRAFGFRAEQAFHDTLEGAGPL